MPSPASIDDRLAETTHTIHRVCRDAEHSYTATTDNHRSVVIYV